MPTLRLRSLVTAGLVDSFGLALGWTTFTLYALARGGLEEVAFYGAAMLVGVALSAPATALLVRRLDGRTLLRRSAAAEAALRIASLVLLATGASPLLVGGSVVLCGLTAFIGFAGMRAEVGLAAPTSAGMAWYVGSIGAVEAAGAAAATLLPAATFAVGGGWALWAVAAVSAVSLAPTYWIARRARVQRAPAERGPRRRLDLGILGGGFLVMMLASGPTLLAVGLAAQLHGRGAVAASAVAFTLGALLAPSAASLLERKGVPGGVAWPLLGVFMIVGWMAAPGSLAGLVLAQLLSGIALGALEGLMDSRCARDGAGGVATVRLAWSGAARALGGAMAVMAAPALLGAISLAAFAAGSAALVGAVGVVAGLLWTPGRGRSVVAADPPPLPIG